MKLSIISGNKNDNGYFLIGSLLMITLLGITLSAYTSIWSTTMLKDREEELKFRLKQIRFGINLYKRKYSYGPSTVKELYDKDYIRKYYKDPFTNKTNWILLKRNGRIVDIHSSTELKNKGDIEYSKW